MYIGLSQRWGCILLHIAAKAIAGLIAQNGGLGWAGDWGLGAYRPWHSSRAGAACTLRLRPVAVGSGLWDHSQ